MGVERFEDGAEEPAQNADTGPPKDTGSPRDARSPQDADRSGDADRSRDPDRSGEPAQSPDVDRPEDPAPETPPRGSPERADVKEERAEPRTRSEYADHIAPPGTPPIEEHSPRNGAEGLSHPEHESPETTLPEEIHPVEPPASKQHKLEQRQPPDDTALPDDRSAINDDSEKQQGVTEEKNNVSIDGIDEAHGDNEPAGEAAEESDTGSEAAPSRVQSPLEIDASDTSPSNHPLINETSTDVAPGDAETTGSELDEHSGDLTAPNTQEQQDSWRRQDGLPLEDRAQPLSREQRAEYITDVLVRLEKAEEAGLSAEDLHTVDPAGEIWSTERTLQHDLLLADLYDRAADVPCEHRAIIAGGLSGAGKTTVLSNHPEIDRSQYLNINPDDIKEEMAHRNMIPEVEGLSPMEASDLVHEESSYLARQLALRAQADGKNLIWDITMSDLKKTEKRIQDLREAGYTRVDGIFVHIPTDVSLRRTEERYWTEQERWLAGRGIGGRLIPPDVILRQKDDEWGSGNRKTFETIKGRFEGWEILDNSVDDRPAVLIERGGKEGKIRGSDWRLHD